MSIDLSQNKNPKALYVFRMFETHYFFAGYRTTDYDVGVNDRLFQYIGHLPARPANFRRIYLRGQNSLGGLMSVWK